MVEKNAKKLQHSFGGIVREINVTNGDRVSGNQVLIRLDPTQIEAELGIINAQLIELTTRKARLSAERDNKITSSCPPASQTGVPITARRPRARNSAI